MFFRKKNKHRLSSENVAISVSEQNNMLRLKKLFSGRDIKLGFVPKC